MHSGKETDVCIQQGRSEVSRVASPLIGRCLMFVSTPDGEMHVKAAHLQSGFRPHAWSERNGKTGKELSFDAANVSTAQRIDDRTDKLIILAKDVRATPRWQGETCASASRATGHEFMARIKELELNLDPQRLGREPKGMRSTKGWGKATGMVAGLVLAGGLLGWTQFPSREGTPLSRQAGAGDTYSPNSEFEAKRLRALNADRHKAMVSDTEKLVKLARQLDAEIASNPTDEWTPEELRKLETIEKLAHTVKTKMAESFGGPEIKPILPPLRSLEEQ